LNVALALAIVAGAAAVAFITLAAFQT